ncbi:hypothetical protein GQ44DRAFT_732670 [Phaeosphaeriaceae sp. PMI808]|nr:hypothetical protein GQ44DRAFT_732670 [Phaeosphaeriaceae sp. PMI808]
MPPLRRSSIEHRRTDADGEKVGLWLACGIFLSICFFTLLLAAFNLFLKNPLRQYRVLKQGEGEKNQTITELRNEVGALKETVVENQVRADAALREVTTIGGYYETLQRANAADAESYHENIAEKDHIIAQRQERIAELEAFEQEVNRLRPAVGEKDDRIRDTRHELDRMTQDRDTEKRAKEESIRRLAFVTAQLAAYHRH